MAGKGPDNKDRSRSLLSDSALPKIEIPRSSRHERREFKLPEKLHTPLPSRAPSAEIEEPRKTNRKRRSSTAKFRDRTQGWFKEGEALETASDSEVTEEIAARSFPVAAVVGGSAALAAILAILWWLR